MRTPVLWDLDKGNETNSTVPGSRRPCQVLVSGNIYVETTWGHIRPSRVGEAQRTRAKPEKVVDLFLRGFRRNLLDHNRGRSATRHITRGVTLSGERQPVCRSDPQGRGIRNWPIVFPVRQNHQRRPCKAATHEKNVCDWSLCSGIFGDFCEELLPQTVTTTLQICQGLAGLKLSAPKHKPPNHHTNFLNTFIAAHLKDCIPEWSTVSRGETIVKIN